MVEEKKYSNRAFYTFVTLSVLILLGAGVYAFGTTAPSKFGHSAGEIDFSGGSLGNIKVDKLKLGDKWVLSGVGDAHNNDGWLRLFGASEGGYYGGIAMANLWVGGTPYLSAIRSCKALETNAGGQIVCGIDEVGSSVDLSNYVQLNANREAVIPSTLFAPGRMHLNGGEYLYLLNKNGVIIGKDWGGNGNLLVQGSLGVGGFFNVAGSRTYLTGVESPGYGAASAGVHIIEGQAGKGFLFRSDGSGNEIQMNGGDLRVTGDIRIGATSPTTSGASCTESELGIIRSCSHQVCEDVYWGENFYPSTVTECMTSPGHYCACVWENDYVSTSWNHNTDRWVSVPKWKLLA